MTAAKLRPLKPLDFRQAMPARIVAKQPQLVMLPLDRLVVDDAYQRPITHQGRSNILRILEDFDWRKFAPLIVVPAGEGRYAIIDGQHRATAALMHPEIDLVPCMVIEATAQEAASCFAAINGAVTSMQKGQMFAARVASGEHWACEIDATVKAAGGRVLKAKASNEAYQPGDTLAVGALETVAKTHGLEVLRITLAAIIRSRDGNPGQLRADAIKALAAVVAARALREAQAIAAMQTVDLGAAITAAIVKAVEDRQPAWQHLRHILDEAVAATLPKARIAVGAVARADELEGAAA